MAMQSAASLCTPTFAHDCCPLTEKIKRFQRLVHVGNRCAEFDQNQLISLINIIFILLFPNLLIMPLTLASIYDPENQKAITIIINNLRPLISYQPQQIYNVQGTQS